MVPSLSTMPAEILGQIFDNIDFMSIQIVRKVCHHLRNHIDHFPPDSKPIDVILCESISRPNLSQDEYISVKYYLTNDQKIEVEYQKNGKNGCRIVYGHREKTLENQDLASVIGNDLGLILRNQMSEMTKIRFYFPTTFKLRLSENCLETFHGRFLVAMTPHMESRRTTIPIKKIEVCGTNQESQIMKILQFLNPSTLNSITILFDKRPGFASPTMKIDRLIGLDQWRQAKDISFQGLSLASNIESFSHLERFVIELKQISGEELVKLREIIIHRPSFFKRFTIHYRHFKNPGPFTSALEGPSFSYYSAWFNVPNDDENALHILWEPKDKWFIFECRKRESADGAIFN